MGLTYETIADLLVGKYSPEKENHISTLRAYEETPIFIPVDISEDLLSWSRKLLESAGPGGMDSEPLQGCLLKFVYHRKNFVLVLNLLWNI